MLDLQNNQEIQPFFLNDAKFATKSESLKDQEFTMQDFELNYQKPPISNMILIVLAIKSMKTQKASAQQIFDFVENTFPFYQDPQISQRKTLRCTLSANKSFVLSKEASTKGLKKQQSGRKGSFWLLNPMKIDEINKILIKNWNTKLKENLKNVTPNPELVEKLFTSEQCSNNFQKSLIAPKKCQKSPNVQFSMIENFNILQEFLKFEKESSKETSMESTQENSLESPQKYSIESLDEYSLETPFETPEEYSLESLREYSLQSPQEYSLQSPKEYSFESLHDYSQGYLIISNVVRQDQNYTQDCLKHDANLANFEVSSQKRVESFEKEAKTLGNGYERPTCLNNTHLVILAIKNSPSGCIVVRDIYAFVVKHFPYFEPLFMKNDEWKRTIRHTLGKEFYKAYAFLAD